MAKAVKASIKQDRAEYVIGQPQRLANAVALGFNPALHRSIKPLKRTSKGADLLLKDVRGNHTQNKTNRGAAMKEHLAVRGRGIMMPYRDLVERSRNRSCDDQTHELSTKAVVGAVDFRCKAANAPAGKAPGPKEIQPEVFRFAAAEMRRLWDPIGVEATLSCDIPLGWQGGDNAMITKSPLAPKQDLDNQREVLLAGQEPKITAGVLRARLCDSL